MPSFLRELRSQYSSTRPLRSRPLSRLQCGKSRLLACTRAGWSGHGIMTPTCRSSAAECWVFLSNYPRLSPAALRSGQAPQDRLRVSMRLFPPLSFLFINRFSCELMLDDDDGLTGLMFGFCVVGNTKKHWNECRRQKFLLFYGYAYELCWIWISWLFMDCLGRRDEPTLPWAVRSQPLPPFLLSHFFSKTLKTSPKQLLTIKETHSKEKPINYNQEKSNNNNTRVYYLFLGPVLSVLEKKWHLVLFLVSLCCLLGFALRIG